MKVVAFFMPSYIDMEEEMVARAEVGALAREEQQAALEMGL